MVIVLVVLVVVIVVVCVKRRSKSGYDVAKSAYYELGTINHSKPILGSKTPCVHVRVCGNCWQETKIISCIIGLSLLDSCTSTI